MYNINQGAQGGYGAAYMDQNMRNRPKPKYAAGGRQYNHGGGTGGDNSFDSTLNSIPSLDGVDRNNLNGGRSLFNYGAADKGAGSMGASADYGLKVPQIGKSSGAGQGVGGMGVGGIPTGPLNAVASPRGGHGPSASVGGGGGGSNRGDSASLGRRNRSATRQATSGNRRGRGDGNDSGSNSVEGPVLPQISGMGASSGAGGMGSVGSSTLNAGIAGASPGGLLGHGTAGIAMQNQMRRQQQQQQQAAAPSYSLGSSVPTTTSNVNGLTITSEEHNYGAVTSIKGLKPGNPNWTNQDNFFVVERFDGKDINFYCVLDGHGENGHHVSKKCRENFPHHIKATNIDMRRAFGLMQNDLLSSEFDVRCSGATCTLAMVSNGRLAVSNCGDSRAVLGRRNPNGSVAAHALTYDHKPDKPEERRRILSCGGHLGCRQVVVNQPGKGPVSVPVGPCRVWYQHMGETLGLAMSRSLGDSVVHRCGVSAEPETLEHTIDDFDEFMVIATDGVWDVLDNNQVVQMVANFSTKSASWSPAEVSATIVKFARSRWEKLSPMVDDITCIVVKLKR